MFTFPALPDFLFMMIRVTLAPRLGAPLRCLLLGAHTLHWGTSVLVLGLQNPCVHQHREESLWPLLEPKSWATSEPLQCSCLMTTPPPRSSLILHSPLLRTQVGGCSYSNMRRELAMHVRETNTHKAKMTDIQQELHLEVEKLISASRTLATPNFTGIIYSWSEFEENTHSDQ